MLRSGAKQLVIVVAWRPAAGVFHVSRSIASRVAFAALDDLLVSNTIDRVTERVLASGVLSRILDQAEVAGVPARVAQRLLADGVAEVIVARVLEGPELERIVALSLESAGLQDTITGALEGPGMERLVERALESPGAERLVTRIVDSTLAEETIVRIVDETVARLPEREALWNLVDEVAGSPSVAEAISQQGLGFADQVADEVRERTRHADARLERMAKRLHWRRPRGKGPVPPMLEPGAP
jgi:hypothetical protein